MQNMMDIKEDQLQWKFLDKKSKGSGIKNEIKEIQNLANELHKPITNKFFKKVYSYFEDNINKQIQQKN